LVYRYLTNQKKKKLHRMFKLTGRVALITGGGTGIGSAVARAYAEAGANVAVAYNTSGKSAEELSAALTKDYGVKSIALQIVANDAVSVENGVKKVHSEFGRLDIVRIWYSSVELKKKIDLSPGRCQRRCWW
jgi:NAD(P)-dependent dehydrogenase (short-subunit alcohol dehydrogenase family)